MNKKFVISFFNSILGFTEYFNLEDKKLVSFLRPDYAWTFNSIKEAQKFIAKYNGTELSLKITPYKKADKDFKKFFDSGFRFRVLPIKNLTLSRKYKKESPDEILKWWKVQNMTEDSEVKYDDYKTWPNLHEVFEHLFNTVAFNNEKYTEKYYTIQMRVNQDSKFEIFKTELEKIVDYITYKNKDDGKIIPIFDHFLSEGGNSASFTINKDGTYSLWISHQNPITGTLEKIFNIWKKERYYE